MFPGRPSRTALAPPPPPTTRQSASKKQNYCKITDYTNILVWWEMVKYKIKQLTIETSRAINLSKSTVEKYEKRINEIKDSNKYLDKNEVNNLQKNH